MLLFKALEGDGYSTAKTEMVWGYRVRHLGCISDFQRHPFLFGPRGSYWERHFDALVISIPGSNPHMTFFLFWPADASVLVLTLYSKP